MRKLQGMKFESGIEDERREVKAKEERDRRKGKGRKLRGRDTQRGK